MVSHQHQGINTGLRHRQQLGFLRFNIITDMARSDNGNAAVNALYHKTRQLNAFF